MVAWKQHIAAGLVLAGLLLAAQGCSGSGPGATVGEQAGAAVGREASDNIVGEAIGAAAGNAAGDQADKAGKGKD